MARRAISSAAVALAVVVSSAWAAESGDQRARNWPQWRGPEATGTAPLGDPPTKWDEQTNVRWKVELPGRGDSTPVVWGGRIFVLSAIQTDKKDETAAADASATVVEYPVKQVAFNEAPATQGTADKAASESSPSAAPAGDKPAGDQPPGDRRGRGGPGGPGGPGGGRGGMGPPKPPSNVYQFVVQCLDRTTGKTLWQQTACEAVPHEGTHPTGSFASASPITDGKHVWCSFGSRGIYCYDMDGKPIWKRDDLGKMKIKMAFGEGSSPALYGDTLVVTWDHEDGSFITALDALTGKEKWKVARDESTTWATPLVVERPGGAQVVVNGMNRSRGYDLATGKVLWECGGQTTNPIPSPVALGDMAICVSGFKGYAAIAIPLSSTGDITDTDKIAWKLSQGTPYVASPLLYNGRLFYTKDRKGIMSCADAKTGEVIIDQKRLPGMEDIYASPVGAAGRVYFLDRGGAVAVIDATADEVNVLAENRLDDTFNASPAIVGREMYLRGDKFLYCIAEK